MEKVNHFIEEQSKLDKSGVDETYSIYIESLDGCLHFIKFQSILFNVWIVRIIVFDDLYRNVLIWSRRMDSQRRI